MAPRSLGIYGPNGLDLLLKHKANVNAKTERGETALFEAAANGAWSVVCRLLEDNADVNAKTETGETALYEATMHGDRKMVELLLKHGADANTKTNLGRTPISLASSHGDKELVELLLKYGADDRDTTILYTRPWSRSQEGPKEWGVLIGASQFAPGRAPNLIGCTNDILLVERYLTETRSVESSRIIKLLGESDAVRSDTNASYDNIIQALVSVTERAEPGDLVYIHYSGHSTQTPTAFPTLKGPGRQDGALVPSDIHQKGQYLRDLEIAFLLRRMVDKKLRPTLVLDCESPFDGRPIHFRDRRTGLSRHVPQSARKPAFFNKIIDLVACAEDNDFPEPRGYTFFAASSHFGQAIEMQIERGLLHGLFTHCLMDKLMHHSTGGPILTRALYRQVRAKMLEKGEYVPVLEGESDCAFFSTDIPGRQLPKLAELPR